MIDLRLLLKKVGRGGVEPPRHCWQEILSLRRLPFRHRPVFSNDDITMLQAVRQYFFRLIRTNLYILLVMYWFRKHQLSSAVFSGHDFYMYDHARIGQACISTICVS